MAKGEINVYGTKLYWENFNGTRVYSAQGARPSDPSLFSGQPAGRIWVASDTADLALYYSDEFGTTRFIQGRDVGGSSQSPGNITTRNFPCPNDTGGQYAPDIYWVSQGPSNNRLMQARAEGIPDMRFLGVNAEVVQIAGTNNWEYRVWTDGYVPLLETMSLATSSAAPYYIQFYSDNTCTTPLTDNAGETKWAQLPSGSLPGTNVIMTIPGPPLQRGSDPASPWFTTASLRINSTTIAGQTPLSFKAVFPTMSIFANNDLSTVAERPSGSVFCNGGDRILLRTAVMGFPLTTQCNLIGEATTTTTTSTTTPVPRCGCNDDVICSLGCIGAGNPCTIADSSNCYVPPF